MLSFTWYLGNTGEALMPQEGPLSAHSPRCCTFRRDAIAGFVEKAGMIGRAETPLKFRAAEVHTAYLRALVQRQIGVFHGAVIRDIGCMN